MQTQGIKARSKRKFVVTTDSKHDLAAAENLLARDFTPTAPDRLWSSDITYIATDEGWLYLAVVIDLFSRMVVGWSMQPHTQASLVTDALRMAWFRRHPAPGLICHSDHGSQYCGLTCQDALASYGMLSSMSRKGNCWDNAPTAKPVGKPESGPAVRQVVRHATPGDGRGDRLVDVLQHRRLHSTLGYISHTRFEANWHAGQAMKAG